MLFGAGVLFWCLLSSLAELCAFRHGGHCFIPFFGTLPCDMLSAFLTFATALSIRVTVGIAFRFRLSKTRRMRRLM